MNTAVWWCGAACLAAVAALWAEARRVARLDRERYWRRHIDTALAAMLRPRSERPPTPMLDAFAIGRASVLAYTDFERSMDRLRVQMMYEPKVVRPPADGGILPPLCP